MYMYKNKILPIISICLLLTFFVQPIFHAHRENEQVNNHNEINRIKTLVENHETYMDTFESSYNLLKSNMESLISEWQINEDAVKKGNQAALTKISIAIVSCAATITSAVLTGGSTIPLAPAIYLAYFGVQDAVEADSIDSSKYVETMGTVLSLMDKAELDLQTIYRNGGSIILPKFDADGYMVKVNGLLVVCPH